MSTSLYFVVNDAFYNKALPKSHLPEGVIFGSLKEMAEQRPELVKKYYGKLADTSKAVSYTHLDVYKRQGSEEADEGSHYQGDSS